MQSSSSSNHHINLTKYATVKSNFSLSNYKTLTVLLLEKSNNQDVVSTCCRLSKWLALCAALYLDCAMEVRASTLVFEIINKYSPYVTAVIVYSQQHLPTSSRNTEYRKYFLKQY